MISKNTSALSNVSLIGFDSAWADNPRRPGAICSLDIDRSGLQEFFHPRLASFGQACEFVATKKGNRKRCVIAIDQPTIVKNKGGMRAVEKVAAAAVSFAGGGVQPANLSKENMFGPHAPIWKFKNDVKTSDDPHEAHIRSQHALVEVYPALALLSLEPAFFQRNAGPKYNPAKKNKFRHDDWIKIIDALMRLNADSNHHEILVWLRDQKSISPTKSDQDCLDSFICLSILMNWLIEPIIPTKVIGDMQSGYILTPVSETVFEKIRPLATKYDVQVSDAN